MSAIERDYDANPGRFLSWRPREDVHRTVAARVTAEGLRPILDLGCGDGRLREAAGPSAGLLGVDRSFTMLCHLDEPLAAIVESYRVLRPGGLFVACTSRRDDSPELCSPARPSTFDAEEAPDIVRGVFDVVEVDAWDAPLVELRSRDEVRRYLTQQMGDLVAADDIEVPVAVTKRGCLVWARKPHR